MSSDTASLVRPATLAELADALRASEATSATVAIRGGGSKATWGAAGDPTEVVIDTTALAGVVEHAPGDLVLSVQAGTPLADVQAALAGHRQWLALDPPDVGGTIGGILATAASGPHRLRHGPPRDQLIGITVVLADGTVARSGGKVVKNVAGYDLGKLFTGSLGTLGVIAAATFKLQPLPLARRIVSLAATAPGEIWAALVGSNAPVAAVEWDGEHIYALVESSTAAVDAIVTRVAAAIGSRQISDTLPTGFGSRPWRPGDVAVKLTHRLAALDAVVAAARQHLPGAALSAHVGSGVVWAGWAAPTAAVALDALIALRAEMASYDGTLVVVDAPVPVKQVVDVWGPVAATDLMHRVKDRFDPDHRLNPGRFVDGI